MENNPSWLLPLLPSRATGALLALLYLHPDRDYSLAEAGRLISASPKVMHTEADRLITAGLVREARRGRARLLRAETNGPVSRPLTDLLAVTYGPLPVLTDLLSEVAGVDQAFVYGSWAARYLGEPGPVPKDVDVLAVGTASDDDLYEAARTAEQRLEREVNISGVSPQYWENPTDRSGDQPGLPLVLWRHRLGLGGNVTEAQRPCNRRPPALAQAAIYRATLIAALSSEVEVETRCRQ